MNVAFTYRHATRTHQKLTKNSIGQSLTINLWSVFFTCNACHGPLSVAGYSGVANYDITKQFGEIKNAAGFHIQSYFPQPSMPDIPGHCPENVAKAFKQAANAMVRGDSDSSVAMDRRALELMTKEKAPDDADKSLIKRIEILGERHVITPDLKDWAHNLRTMGNEALHGVDGLTVEEATSTHELTKFILTYVYSLPEQVRLAKEKRDAEKQ